jgi:hypothetical protein
MVWLHDWVLKNWPDLANAGLEVVGGMLILLHSRAAWRAWEIKGVHWAPFVFFATWGGWNLWYYHQAGQWLSGYAAWFPFAANTVFLGLWGVISLTHYWGRATHVLHTAGDFHPETEVDRERRFRAAGGM